MPDEGNREFQGWYCRIHPFRQPAFWRVVPDGSSIVTVQMSGEPMAGQHFAVSKIRIDGDTVFSRDYGYAPKRITSHVRRLAADKIVSRLSTGPRPVDITVQAVLGALDSPDHIPPVSELAAGVDQTVWLRREDTFDDRVPWDVIGENGELVATVNTPRRCWIRWVTQDAVWAIEEDAMDVVSVVRYRLERI